MCIRDRDYAAAYNAYLQSVSGNSSLEYANNIKDILSRYGYEDQQTFAQALGCLLYTSKVSRKMRSITPRKSGYPKYLFSANRSIRSAAEAPRLRRG